MKKPKREKIEEWLNELSFIAGFLIAFGITSLSLEDIKKYFRELK